MGVDYWVTRIGLVACAVALVSFTYLISYEQGFIEGREHGKIIGESRGYTRASAEYIPKLKREYNRALIDAKQSVVKLLDGMVKEVK